MQRHPIVGVLSVARQVVVLLAPVARRAPAQRHLTRDGLVRLGPRRGAHPAPVHPRPLPARRRPRPGAPGRIGQLRHHRLEHLRLHDRIPRSHHTRKDLVLMHHEPGVAGPQQHIPQRLRRPRHPPHGRGVLAPQILGQRREADALQQPVRTVEDHSGFLRDRADPGPAIPATVPRARVVIRPAPVRHLRRPGTEPVRAAAPAVLAVDRLPQPGRADPPGGVPAGLVRHRHHDPRQRDLRVGAAIGEPQRSRQRPGVGPGLLHNVNQVFQVPGVADGPVQVDRQHGLRLAVAQPVQQLAEPGPDHPPRRAPVREHHLAPLVRRGRLGLATGHVVLHDDLTHRPAVGVGPVAQHPLVLNQTLRLTVGVQVFHPQVRQPQVQINNRRGVMRGHTSIMMLQTKPDSGKTALALHWAHRIRHRFPDGQLYVNLRGYDPGEPRPAGEVLAAFLRGLGVAGADVPVDADERAARYRTLLASRRVLVVLDNAANADQVRPLLPASSTCLALITSRDRLAGLAARDGVRRVGLDRLDPAEAVALLRALLGPARVADEPAAAGALARHCAGLPLALRIAAEHAAGRPGEPLARLVAELDRQGLDGLDAGDEHSAVRAVFSWSYRHLPGRAAAAFRLLGLHPGRHVNRATLAALAGCRPAQADRLLTMLAAAHLVERAGPGRYTIHDLLRTYAAELAAADPANTRAAALDRLLDHYVHTTAAAKDALHPWDRPPGRDLPGRPDHAARFDTADEAAGWFEAELPNLVAVAVAVAVARTAADGRPRHAVWLSILLWRYLNLANRTDEALVVHAAAARAAAGAGDTAGQAGAEFRIGDVWWRVGRYTDAASHFTRALQLRQVTGDRAGQAHALGGLALVQTRTGRYAAAWTAINLGTVLHRSGRPGDATEHYRRAIATARDLGARSIEATALNRLGATLFRLGRLPEAITHHRQALDLHRETGDRAGEAESLHGLGACHDALGEPAAIGELEQALTVRRALGDRSGQAQTLNALGRAAYRAARYHDATGYHEQALTVSEDLGDRCQQADALDGLARAHEATGQSTQAHRHRRRADALRAELGEPADPGR